ncbi:MAG: hypothetical protein V4564_07655 [Pseudomonadota bacterium]
MTAATTPKPRLSQQVSSELQRAVEDAATEAGCSTSDLLRKVIGDAEAAWLKKVKK